MSNDGRDSIRNWPTKFYDFKLPVRYHLSGPKDAGVVICLHGFQDHALSMMRRIGWWNNQPPFQTLALNGPFPVPKWTEQGFIEAYSWYFRDTRAEIMLVHPSTTARALKTLIDDTGFAETPKVIFGFSQGGYMSPYLAAELKNVKGIVGYGCGYNNEAYSALPPTVVHAVHGDIDERISLANAQKDYAEIHQFGHTGAFHEVPGLTHRVETTAEPLVRKLIEGMFRQP